jgi:hypothetical protein
VQKIAAKGASQGGTVSSQNSRVALPDLQDLSIEP